MAPSVPIAAAAPRSPVLCHELLPSLIKRVKIDTKPYLGPELCHLAFACRLAWTGQDNIQQQLPATPSKIAPNHGELQHPSSHPRKGSAAPGYP